MDDLRISGRDFSTYQSPAPFGVLPQGSLPITDWIMAAIMRGYGWHFEVGGFASGTDTAITGGGNGTVMDLDQPEFGISVPSGWICVPHEIRIQARPGLQTTDAHVTDILLAVDRTAKWAGDGTVTTETPLNLRSDISGGCPLPCFSAATGDITDPVISLELARMTGAEDFQGTPADSIIRSMLLEYMPLRPPLVVGPAGIYGYFGGSIATTGFAQVNFLALPAFLFTGLS